MAQENTTRADDSGDADKAAGVTQYCDKGEHRLSCVVINGYESPVETRGDAPQCLSRVRGVGVTNERETAT